MRSKNGEATDQHLKIWRDPVSQECSISFYASAISKPRHVEYPINMFNSHISVNDDVELCLSFVGAEELKRTPSLSMVFSRSPTEKTTSSSSTTGMWYDSGSYSMLTYPVPGVFTRSNTGILSGASSVTTAPSRMSVASAQSDGGHGQSDRSKNEVSLEAQAKQLKYFRIEFSDEVGRWRTAITSTNAYII